MQKLRDALQSILGEPTPAALVTLQGALLAQERADPRVEAALRVAGRFHAFLSELQSKLTAEQYSELASRLDIGAVGAVALEGILAADKEDMGPHLILGGLAEGLMVAASRQYIKGWRAETELVFTQTAWYLTEALWHISRQMRPDLPAEERWQAIRSLLAPAGAPSVPAPAKALLLGRIFQVLLLTHLAQLLPPR